MKTDVLNVRSGEIRRAFLQDVHVVPHSLVWSEGIIF